MDYHFTITTLPATFTRSSVLVHYFKTVDSASEWASLYIILSGWPCNPQFWNCEKGSNGSAEKLKKIASALTPISRCEGSARKSNDWFWSFLGYKIQKPLVERGLEQACQGSYGWDYQDCIETESGAIWTVEVYRSAPSACFQLPTSETSQSESDKKEAP